LKVKGILFCLFSKVKELWTLEVVDEDRQQVYRSAVLTEATLIIQSVHHLLLSKVSLPLKQNQLLCEAATSDLCCSIKDVA
jgi:hypothetical protein